MRRRIRKLKKSTKQYIIVACLCMLTIGGTGITAYIIFTNYIKNTYHAQLSLIRQEVKDNKKEIYVVSEDLRAGDVLNTSNTQFVEGYASLPYETYITNEDMGKVLLIDAQKGVQLLKTMVSKEEINSDIREVCYEVITINGNIEHNDKVDIRILYPNGENYIVLSQKQIKQLSENMRESYFWLSEEEIIRMSSAIVDAYLYQGTILYTAKYIESAIQEPSVITYTPSLSAIELIKNNPNIVTTASTYLSSLVRKELENRLAESTKVLVEEINWKVDKKEENDGFVYFTEEEKERELEYEYGE